MAKQSYKWPVFKHPMNVAFLAGIGLAGLIQGWPLLALGLLAEVVLVLWMVPDLPFVQRALDNQMRVERIERQRWYYLKTLWGGELPQASNPFFSTSPKWSEVVGEPWDPDRKSFKNLCRTIEDLQEYQKAHPEAVTDDLILRMEEMINAWMGLLYLIRNTTQSISQINQDALAKDFAKLKAQVDKVDPNDKATRLVLGERLRSIKSKVDNLPKLERRKSLATSQAETLVAQIEALSTQVRTSGAIEAGTLLDTSAMLDGGVFNTGPDEVEMAAEIRSLTTGSDLDLDNPDVWKDIGSKLGSDKPALTHEEPAVFPFPSGRTSKVPSRKG